MKAYTQPAGRLLLRAARSLIRNALDFIYPPVCPLCDQANPDSAIPLCASCWTRLPRLSEPRLTPPDDGAHFDAAFAVFGYTPEVQQLVHEFKYRGWRGLARPLGEEMGRILSGIDGITTFEALVPVPLHRRRLRERGYNQSLLLARAASRICGVPVLSDLIVRRRETAPQARLPRSGRNDNVRGAFAFCLRGNGRPPASAIVIDDVFTTGSTLNECARVLKQGGIVKVVCATLAHVDDTS